MLIRVVWLLWLLSVLGVVLGPRSSHAAGVDVTVCLPLAANQYGLDANGCPATTPQNVPPVDTTIDAVMNCIISAIDGTKKCIETKINNQSAGRTPPGWSSPISPPATASNTGQGWGPVSALYYSTSVAGCNAFHGRTDMTTQVVSAVQHGCYLADGVSHQGFIFYNTACPVGYSHNGTVGAVCTLSSPSSVMKPSDGHCTIKRSGNSFSGDAQDPDCSLTGTTAAAQAGQTTSSTQSKATGAGGRTSSTTTVNASTGVSTTSIVTNNNNGTTTTTIINMSNPAPGTGTAVVTGTSSTTTQGTGDLATTVPTPGDGEFPEFPTDYNRETTQQAIKDLLTVPPQGATDLAAEKAAIDAAAEDYSDLIEGVGTGGLNAHGISWSWVPSMPSGVCVPFTGSVLGRSISWDVCPKFDVIRQVMAWLLYVLTGWLIMGIFMRKGA